ncbi:MAG: hypothetical protein R3F31_13045 [Verrucomicrobiales bacterium]
MIRDILGAGRGAKPIGSLDVFCFGPPDVSQAGIRGDDAIHPLGIMRGVVRGYATMATAWVFPPSRAPSSSGRRLHLQPARFLRHRRERIAIKDIPKEVLPGQRIIAVGGRTGRDGLKERPFLGCLDTDSQCGRPTGGADRQTDRGKSGGLRLAARDSYLIGFITDCGAGGFSSLREMLSEGAGKSFSTTPR